MTPNQFIDQYSKLASLGTLGTPIFPSVTMAQAIIESGWGKDPTATQANNFFGIKDSDKWNGPTIVLPTPNDSTPFSAFRKYIDASESFRDHINFFYDNARYRSPSHNVFTAPTPGEQCQAIAKAGYAEAPNYAATLITLINQYDLKKLDKKKIT